MAIPEEQLEAAKKHDEVVGAGIDRLLAIQSHIVGLPLAKDKVVKMKVVTQKLVADIGGEPFELMRLVLTREGDMKITLLYDSCADLGMDQSTVDRLIASATAKAEADRLSR